MSRKFRFKNSQNKKYYFSNFKNFLEKMFASTWAIEIVEVEGKEMEWNNFCSRYFSTREFEKFEK